MASEDAEGRGAPGSRPDAYRPGSLPCGRKRENEDEDGEVPQPQHGARMHPEDDNNVAQQ